MDIKNVSIVTAIFDIGRDKWDNFTMSYHTYCWWMRSLLYLDTNLIIYTEEKFKEISHAYEILSDDKKRGEYDEMRDAFKSGRIPHGGAPGGGTN